LVGLGRSSYHYRPRGRKDGKLVQRLRRIAGKHKRYGYRRAWAVLRREGEVINRKRVYRVWRQEQLSLARRRPRRRRRGMGSVPQAASHPNHVWTYDFLEDCCSNGPKLRILTVVDEFTRECLAIRTERYFPAWKVQRVLEGLFGEHGAPRYVRSDNGPEFIERALQAWLAQGGSETIYIEPGSPWQNAFGESFNGKFRDECLNVEVFANVAEARVLLVPLVTPPAAAAWPSTTLRSVTCWACCTHPRPTAPTAEPFDAPSDPIC
jgi:putative transposase